MRKNRSSREYWPRMSLCVVQNTRLRVGLATKWTRLYNTLKRFSNSLFPLITHLSQIADVFKEMSEEYNGFTEGCHILKQLQPLVKAKRFLSEAELDLLEKLCLEVGVVFPRVFKGTISPKIHDLVFHLPRIARHLGTVGRVREDVLESKHAIGNGLKRRLACVQAEEQKLKLMLQLDEVQLRMKSAEFSKPVFKRVRKRNSGRS